MERLGCDVAGGVHASHQEMSKLDLENSITDGAEAPENNDEQLKEKTRRQETHQNALGSHPTPPAVSGDGRRAWILSTIRAPVSVDDALLATLYRSPQVCVFFKERRLLSSCE